MYRAFGRDEGLGAGPTKVESRASGFQFLTTSLSRHAATGTSETFVGSGAPHHAPPGTACSPCTGFAPSSGAGMGPTGRVTVGSSSAGGSGAAAAAELGR